MGDTHGKIPKQETKDIQSRREQKSREEEERAQRGNREDAQSHNGIS